MRKSIYLLFVLASAASISRAQNEITWGTGMNVATSSTGNDHPRMDVTRSGDPLIIWNNSGKAMFSRWNGTAFTAPVVLNPLTMNVAGADWMGPDIAAHGDTLYVVFKQTPEASDTCHIYCVHSYNAGASFSPPVRVDYINDSISRFPTVTTDDSGNPIIGFMKFDPSFNDARWVVVRSADFGKTFSIDVKASGWSNVASTVCDCCPGAIICSGNNVAMLYRDNNSNIRDSWAGISFDKAISFAGGMNIDQKSWNIPACPSTGPDGIIIGDTLYSTFMSGASGKSLVYFGRASLSAISSTPAISLAATVPGMTLQNYPRIASDGTALAVVWKQVVSGSDQCVLRFAGNIANGLPAAYDTVDLNNITNADVSIRKGNIFVVWQDDNSGTVKYRKGTFASVTDSEEDALQASFSIFPNPASLTVNILFKKNIDDVRVEDFLGRSIYRGKPEEKNISIDVGKAGIYFVTVISDGKKYTKKLVAAK